MALENWEDVLSCNETNTAYEYFWDKFSYYFNKNIPVEEINITKQKKKHPSITIGILKSIKRIKGINYINYIYEISLTLNASISIKDIEIS